MRRNILYFEAGMGFGGAVTCLAELLKKLNRRKFNPLVVSTHNDRETQNLIKASQTEFLYIKLFTRKEIINKFLARLSCIALIKGVFLLVLFFFERILRLSFLVKFILFIIKNKISLIHLNTGGIDSNFEAILAAKIFRIPCVAHVRGGVYDSLVLRYIFKNVTYFIAVSNFVKDKLIKVGVNQNKIQVVYDGVDIHGCLRKKTMNSVISSYEFGVFNAGLFACIVWWKGHKVFIEAVNILIKEKKLKNCKFFIVGDVVDKKSKLKEELIDLVNKLSLEDYIVFTGHQDNVFSFMDKMDIIVHASISPEPLGTTIIEAMALGKPIVATEMGGPLEMIENGVDGILIEPGNPKILAEKILFLLSNRNKRIEIGRNAQITARKKFSIESHVRKIEKIYEEILK